MICILKLHGINSLNFNLYKTKIYPRYFYCKKLISFRFDYFNYISKKDFIIPTDKQKHNIIMNIITYNYLKHKLL